MSGLLVWLATLAISVCLALATDVALVKAADDAMGATPPSTDNGGRAFEQYLGLASWLPAAQGDPRCPQRPA